MARVQDILEHKGDAVVTCAPGDTALQAARVMNEHGIGAVVVVEGGRMAGIFTERDVLCRVVAAGRDPGQTPLRDVMTQPVITCGPATQLNECRAIVMVRRVRHLPVLQEGALRGIITSGDIMAQQLREQQEATEYLKGWVYDGR